MDSKAKSSACKSAVVHAETLLKLARWTEDEKTLPQQENILGIDSLLQEARNELEETEDED